MSQKTYADGIIDEQSMYGSVPLDELTHVQQMTRRWAHMLTTPLTAGSFQSTVRVDFDDGSLVHFQYAFALTDPAWPRLVGIFTEHCGYHELYIGPHDRLTVTPYQAQEKAR